ncbi:MAG TPA: hypothetical protein VN885_09785 [Candidatus Acidoferrales bacterium]|nr:hypothetical protein [Candidatus Acidoferrales bacterium]
MTDLLDLAVMAHGGLDRWNKVNSVRVAASITGAIWFVKGKGDALKNVVMTIDTRKERLTTDFLDQDKRTVFESARIVIEKTDGTLIDARNDPEKSFQGQKRETPWDDIYVDGLLRRHDYTVDILGGARGLNYASEYRDVDGIIIPTKRRIYAYEGDDRLVKEPLLVAIDMGEITLT